MKPAAVMVPAIIIRNGGVDQMRLALHLGQMTTFLAKPSIYNFALARSSGTDSRNCDMKSRRPSYEARHQTQVSDGSQPTTTFDSYRELNGWLPFAGPSA